MPFPNRRKKYNKNYIKRLVEEGGKPVKTNDLFWKMCDKFEKQLFEKWKEENDNEIYDAAYNKGRNIADYHYNVAYHLCED